MGIDPASPGDGVNDIIYFGTEIRLNLPIPVIASTPHLATCMPILIPWPSLRVLLPQLYTSVLTAAFIDPLTVGQCGIRLVAGGLQTGVFYNVDVKPDATASVTVGALQDNGLQTNKGAVGLAWKSGNGAMASMLLSIQELHLKYMRLQMHRAT